MRKFNNVFEIVFLRWIANTAACSSKRDIVKDFSLTGGKQDFNNRKLEISFSGHLEK